MARIKYALEWETQVLETSVKKNSRECKYFIELKVHSQKATNCSHLYILYLVHMASQSANINAIVGCKLN